jgi:hypothetical protein
MNAAERAAQYQQVVTLNRLGMPITEIANMLGLTGIKEARRILRRALRELCGEQAEDIRQQELDRLARLEALLWPEAIKSVADCNNVAFGRLLRTVELRLEWSGCRPAPLPPVLQDNSLKIQIVNFTEPSLEDVPLRLAAAIGEGGGESVELADEDEPGARSVPSDVPYDEDQHGTC